MFQARETRHGTLAAYDRWAMANGQTGEQAVDRLIERGGQVVVYRRGYGMSMLVTLVERVPDGETIEIEEHDVAPGGEPARTKGRTSRRTLRSDADRATLARDLERNRDQANTGLDRVEYSFVIEQRDELQTDAGYGQIGCFLIFGSVFLGDLLGLLGGWLATGQLVGSGWFVGPIVGLAVGFLTTDWIGGVFAGIRATRDRQTGLAMLWSAIVPGLATTVVVTVMTIAAAGSGHNP